MTADQLFMVHRRLGNQMPCRYYLDAKGDGSCSHVCLECYFPVCDGVAEGDQRLIQDLAQFGMRPYDYYRDTWRFPADGFQNGFFVRRYVAERSKTEQGGYI